jgi:uncharacterized membrane protein
MIKKLTIFSPDKNAWTYYLSLCFLVFGIMLAGFGLPRRITGSLSWLFVVGSVAGSFVLIVYDLRLLGRCDHAQKMRLAFSNLLGSALFLMPVAMRLPKGSTIHAFADLICYAGCVCLCAYGFAARVEPLIKQTRSLKTEATAMFAIALVAYVLILGLMLTALYNAYTMEWVDFSFEFPSFWQSLRSWPFRTIDLMSREVSVLQWHWPIIYLALSPLSFLWNDPRLLLWLETLFVGGAACATFLLAKQRMGWASAAAIGTLFLLYLPVHCVNLEDVHSDPFAMVFMLLSFFFAEKKRWGMFAVSAGVAILCKEYVGIAYVGYGIYLAGKNRIAGAATAAAGLAWFFFVVKIGVPLFNRGLQPVVIGDNYGFLPHNGGLLGMILFPFCHPDVIASVLFRPNNVIGFTSMLLPFALMPVLRPYILGAGILIELKNGLSSSGIELLLHREALYVPFVVYAFISYVGSLSEPSRRRFVLIAAIVAASLTFLLQGHAFPSRGFWLERARFTVTSHDRICNDLIKKIPPDAPVMSSSRFSPHLMTRRWYFLFPNFGLGIQPEYVLVDTLRQSEWEWYPAEKLRNGFAALQKNNKYRLIEGQDGVFLFRKNPPQNVGISE